MPKEILSLLGSLSDKSYLSIDWDVRTLRIVHARVTRRDAEVDQVLSVAVPRDVRMHEAESLGRFIAQALSKAGLNTKRAVVDIPRDKVNIYTLELPRASVSDLAGMVAFQIPKELPFPADQAVVDFTVPPLCEGDTVSVMVAAVRKEVLAFYATVFEHAGLKLQRVGLRPNANRFAVNALLQATPNDLTLFVDVGPRTTEIDMVRKGQLVFSRAADVVIPESLEGGVGEAEPDAGAEREPGDGAVLSLVTPTGSNEPVLDKVVRELMIEVTRSIEAYRMAEAGARIDHAVIGGSCDIEEALAEAVQKQYNLIAQPYNPASCFGWEADRGAAAGAFAATLGLVLAQGQASELNFDFLHPKRPVSRTERRIRKAPVAVAAAVLFIVAGVVFYVGSIQPEYRTRDQLRREIAGIDKVLSQHEEFIRLVEVIEEYDTRQIVWLDKLRDVVTTLPEQTQIVLTSMDFSEKDGRIKAPFKAKSSAVGSETVAALEAFRPEGSDRPEFKVTTGTSSVKTRESYQHSGSLEINVVDRAAPVGGKPRR